MGADEIKALADAMGVGGALIALGIIALLTLVPVLRREKVASKPFQIPASEIVTDADLLVFMTEHRLRIEGLERRIEKLETKCGN
jgi:hypothetical protein